MVSLEVNLFQQSPGSDGKQRVPRRGELAFVSAWVDRDGPVAGWKGGFIVSRVSKIPEFVKINWLTPGDFSG
jgi:hypothetical protein